MRYILILLILCSCGVKHRAAMTHDWNHPMFKQGDTVINITNHYIFSYIGMHRLFTISSVVSRPGKHQLFYTGVSMSHNDTVFYMPECSIKRVRLWWDGNGAHVKEIK